MAYLGHVLVHLPSLNFKLLKLFAHLKMEKSWYGKVKKQTNIQSKKCNKATKPAQPPSFYGCTCTVGVARMCRTVRLSMYCIRVLLTAHTCELCPHRWGGKTGRTHLTLLLNNNLMIVKFNWKTLLFWFRLLLLLLLLLLHECTLPKFYLKGF